MINKETREVIVKRKFDRWSEFWRVMKDKTPPFGDLYAVGGEVYTFKQGTGVDMFTKNPGKWVLVYRKTKPILKA